MRSSVSLVMNKIDMTTDDMITMHDLMKYPKTLTWACPR